MSNMFDKTRQKWAGSPYVIWVFTVGLMLLLIGIVLFVEDMMSSLQGIQQLEVVYNIDPVNIQITYFAIALSSQVAQIAFMFLFLIDTKKNRWSLGIVAFFFIIDLISDVQDRSGSWLFSPSGINLDSRTGVATLLSLVFFTVGSELFISTGFGLAISLFQPANEQLGKLFSLRRKKRPASTSASSNRGGHSSGIDLEHLLVESEYPDAGRPRSGRNSNMRVS